MLYASADALCARVCLQVLAWDVCAVGARSLSGDALYVRMCLQALAGVVRAVGARALCFPSLC